MGVYGLVRVTGILPGLAPGWGLLVLGLGLVSGVMGVLYAIGQHDLKRLLAYHSVENIGIIFMGLGLAMLGRAWQRPELVALGLGACLLHVWNHALFKPLLFFSAGSVVHACATRSLEHLGGLAKRMPVTALGFFTGAVAICGLPPLNGFVSEFLLALAGFKSLQANASPWGLAASLVAPGLALIGALALACFVKAYGTVFLGAARTPRAERAQESPWPMLVPMFVLGAACLLIGLFPAQVFDLLGPALRDWDPSLGAGALPGRELLVPVGLAARWLLALLALGGLLAWGLKARRSTRRAGTWACGFVEPAPRAQYTASSLGQMLLAIFRPALRPHEQNPRLTRVFCPEASYGSAVPDAVLDGVLSPLMRRLQAILARVRGVQRGDSQRYLLYVVLALAALMAWYFMSLNWALALFTE